MYGGCSNSFKGFGVFPLVMVKSSANKWILLIGCFMSFVMSFIPIRNSITLRADS